MHERLRQHSMAAWQQVMSGGSSTSPNILPDLVSTDDEILAYIEPENVRALMNAGSYVGDAPERARLLAAQIRGTLA
jgi:adenylosuccinate lyase